jgi:hypothetical protein
LHRRRGKYCSQACARKAPSFLTANGIPKSLGGRPFGYFKANPQIPGVDSKHLGALAEIMACEWLIRQGYELFRNISQHGLADYVAWKPGEKPILIDVKGNRAAKPSQAQVAAGVRLLYVDRDQRIISFDRADIKPRAAPDVRVGQRLPANDRIQA